VSGAAALVGALRRLLGDERVTSCLEAPDVDPRTSEPVSGAPLGAPVAWVRPGDTAACAAVVQAAAGAGVPVAVVGDATTFWDGLRVGGGVVIDARALAGPLAVDAERRVAWVGAGRSVREVDRAARARGLALAAYPDSSGDTPVGSMLAVGCTAGLGMGTALPLEQVTGATVVTGAGEVVRLGASHALGHAAFSRHGLPDALGLFAAAEGRAGVVTEVGLSLVPAGFIVDGRVGGEAQALPVAAVLRALRAARRGLDRGGLDSFRFEAGVREGRRAVDWEVYFRARSVRSPEDAAVEARAVAVALKELGFPAASLALESEAARRGESPDHEGRFSVPPGEHRARLRQGAFWGAEVAVGWGDELPASLARLEALFAEVGALDPIHRRLGVYPGHHAVSVGVQVLGRRDAASVEALRRCLAAALPDLAALGVPYRQGNLWRSSLEVHPGARAASLFMERLLGVMVPAGTLPGARGGAPR
jgi:FAD/FMN-containing dehydrogenase